MDESIGYWVRELMGDDGGGWWVMMVVLVGSGTVVVVVVVDGFGVWLISFSSFFFLYHPSPAHTSLKGPWYAAAPQHRRSVKDPEADAHFFSDSCAVPTRT